jgi:hypothetical protein
MIIITGGLERFVEPRLSHPRPLASTVTSTLARGRPLVPHARRLVLVSHSDASYRAMHPVRAFFAARRYAEPMASREVHPRRAAGQPDPRRGGRWGAPYALAVAPAGQRVRAPAAIYERAAPHPARRLLLHGPLGSGPAIGVELDGVGP